MSLFAKLKITAWAYVHLATRTPIGVEMVRTKGDRGPGRGWIKLRERDAARERVIRKLRRAWELRNGLLVAEALEQLEEHERK